MPPPPPVATFLRLAAHGLLDFVYPPRCLVCDAPNTPPLCPQCVAAFAPIPEPVCTVCGRPMEGDAAPCPTCARQTEGWSFVLARAGGIYSGALREAIHALKFNGRETLGEPLGAFLANRLLADGLLPVSVQKEITAVACVPMGRARENARGFNQARLLASPVAAMLGVPLLPPTVLRRVRKTAPQVGLSARARRGNLDGAFAVQGEAGKALPPGSAILLIDDVFTTGATVNACARALTDAGVARVYVACLAAGG